MEAHHAEVEHISPAAERRRGTDRRQGGRRGMEALRAEALQSVIARVEDRNFGDLRDRTRWSSGVKPSRILLLVVALVAGGLAAFLAVRRDQVISPAVAAAPTEVVVQEARTQVLVAKADIAIGQRILPDSVEWVDWPRATVRPEFITAEIMPDAVTALSGAVVRHEFFAGEPIRERKLVRSAGGYLSALLDGGTRGVSVTVSAQSASGGLIVPDDRVDVVLTRSTDSDQSSETILTNVRVVAINGQLGAPQGEAQPQAFTDATIATLALDPQQAEVVIAAQARGTLSLILRPAGDVADSEDAARRAANQAIRMTSPFWQN